MSPRTTTNGATAGYNSRRDWMFTTPTPTPPAHGRTAAALSLAGGAR
ncbi:hypothetical protein ACFV6U_34580 [Streptomyces sp. NPDC059810]